MEDVERKKRRNALGRKKTCSLGRRKIDCVLRPIILTRMGLGGNIYSINGKRNHVADICYCVSVSLHQEIPDYRAYFTRPWGHRYDAKLC